MESREKKPGKIFAVGDIHGCYEKLVTLMNRLPFDLHYDTLIFLGDYINRGSQSREVIEYLIDLKKKCKNIVFLKGNHEHALLQYAQTEDQEYLRLLRSMDVELTLKSYSDAKFQSLSDLGFLPPSHLDFLNGLLTYYKTVDYLFHSVFLLLVLFDVFFVSALFHHPSYANPVRVRRPYLLSKNES